MKKLVDIVKRLRSPTGCPWDRKQTHPSLVPYLLEETWEVINEIQQEKIGDPLKEELGDLLLQIVLHAQIAAEEGRFDINDVIEAISTKMIHRHPHVFAGGKQDLSDSALKDQWLRLKSLEKKSESVLEGIPPGAPALMNAVTLSRKAAGLGFDWESPWDVVLKIEEELDEVRNELENRHPEKLEEEIGDLLFTVANLARLCRINPEIALKKGNDKFKRRFDVLEKMIQAAKAEGRRLSMEEMERYWTEFKQQSPDRS